MVFKINISEKGKAWKIESDNENFIGKKIGDKLEGQEISSDLAGYELEITGTSDNAGFPGFKEVDGPGTKALLLGYGKGMHKKPKGLSKQPGEKPRGLRKRKTVRGNTLSKDTAQINIKVLKSGAKKLEGIFPEQNKPKEKKVEDPAETPAQ